MFTFPKNSLNTVRTTESEQETVNKFTKFFKFILKFTRIFRCGKKNIKKHK